MVLNYQPFRFWCQKVLPLVYDDSLSYMELLSKVIDKLNQMGEGYNELAEAFIKLKEYVETFVSEEIEPIIDAKLQEMLEDGTIEGIVARLMVVDYVTPDMFGAVGDNTTDDTVAVQAAFDDGRAVCFPLNKRYRITDTIHIRKKWPVTNVEELERLHNLGVYKLGRSAFSKAPSNSANPGPTIKVDLSDTDKYAFSIEVSDWTFENLIIEGQKTNNYWYNKLFTIAIENTETVNAADVDFAIKDCRIAGFDTFMDFTGRGCLIENCNFAHVANLIDIKWNDEDDSGAFYHDAATGPRAIRIVGNRLHSCHGLEPLIRVRSGSAFGLEFINNHIDRGHCGLLRTDSAIDNWLIANNNITGMRNIQGMSAMIAFRDDIKNCQFVNNRISQTYPGESSSIHFDNVIQFAAGTKAENCIFSNNVVSNLNDGQFIIAPNSVESGEEVLESCNFDGCVFNGNAIENIDDTEHYRGLIRARVLRMNKCSVIGNVIGKTSGNGGCAIIVSGGSGYMNRCKVYGNVVPNSNVTVVADGDGAIMNKTNCLIDDDLFNVLWLPDYTGSDANKVLAVNSGSNGIEWHTLNTGNTGFISVPEYGNTDAGKCLAVNSDGSDIEWETVDAEKVGVISVPEYDVSDAGKCLAVNSGGDDLEWETIDAEKVGVISVPEYGVSDAGKSLNVNSGGNGLEWNEIIGVPSFTDGDEDKALSVNGNANGLEWREMTWPG